MNILDRHIFKSVLYTCLGAVGLLTFVLMIGNVVKELMGHVLAGQIDLMTFGRLLALLVPFAVTFALPMGILTGVLLTLGRLSADSEITAMRSSGIGLWRISRPIVILAVLSSSLAFYINHEAMPWARATYKRELSDAVRANPLSFIVPRTFIRNFPGVIVYVSDKKGAELEDLWLWQLDKEQRVVRQMHADKGRLSYNDATNTLILTLQKAQLEKRRDGTPEDFKEPSLIATFDETEAVSLPLDKMFSKNVVRTKLDFLPYTELLSEKQRLSVAPQGEKPEQKIERARQITRIELVISERFNNALAVLSFALIGVPLGITVSRRETSANLGMALALALTYYILTTAIGWLSQKPELHPEYLFYFPNLLFLSLAILLFRRAEAN